MESIWLKDHIARYEPLMGDARADVVVVGGGIAGMTAAYLLSAAGVGVTVLEASAIGSGQSGHGAAMVTAQHGLCFAKMTNRFGLERARLAAWALEGAVHLLAGIVSSEEIACDFLPQDSFVYTADHRMAEAIEREAEAASRLGFPADITNIAPFILPYRVAVRIRDQAMFHPVKYLRGLASAIIRNGGCIHEGSPVAAIHQGVVSTGAGRLQAKCVLVTTHMPILHSPLHNSLRFSNAAGWVAAVDGAPVPVGMWQDAAGGMCFRAAADKLIACTGGNRGNGSQTYDAFMQCLRDLFPGSAPVAWPAQYLKSLDGLPYIGNYARAGGCLFVATGFGRWGVTGGTMAGHILCDQVLDKPNPSVELFHPKRPHDPQAIGSAIARAVAAGWKLVSSSMRKRKSAL